MAANRKVVKFFLASPSDLQEERRAAKSVADEFNSLWAEKLGYQVELVGWEDTVAGFGRPQAIINQDLERCEIFIGVMWKRWGSPPDTSGEFSSGFEEEFTLSLRSRETSNRPEMSLFFKAIDTELLRDPGDELKRVLTFRDKITNEKKILYETFSDASDFSEKIRRCFTRHIQRLYEQDRVGELGEQSKAPEKSSEVAPKAETAQQNLAKASIFLRVAARELESSENEALSAEEVARLRLIASTLAKSDNDRDALGVHDANLMFTSRTTLDLSYAERSGLIRSGLQHLSAQNVPLWHWVGSVGGFNRSILPVFALFDATDRRVGALTAMRIIGETIPDDDDDGFSRKAFITGWLSDDAAPEARVAALKYLEDLGQQDDLEGIKAEFDKGNYQTATAAADAYIAISLRDGRAQGLQAIISLQSEAIDAQLISEVFSGAGILPAELLHEGLSHSCADVRERSLKALAGRHALTTESAQRLLADASAKVRLTALLALVDLGERYSQDEARKHLVRSGRSRGLFSYSTTTEGEDQLKRFIEEQSTRLGDKELTDALLSSTMLDKTAYFADARRHFASRSEGLRQAIDDRYESRFNNDLERMEREFGKVDLIEKIRGLKEGVRKEWTRGALDVLGLRGSAADLPRLRQLLKSGFVDHSAADIEFFRRFGEWEDVSVLAGASTVQRRGRGALGALSLLSKPDREIQAKIAGALYRIGKDRFDELVKVDMDPQLRAELLVIASDTAFRKLPIKTLHWLLGAREDAVRRVTALKAVKTLTKAKLTTLMEKHKSPDGSRYYNVIHWLDLGISAPKDRAVAAAARALTRERLT